MNNRNNTEYVADYLIFILAQSQFQIIICENVKLQENI